MISKSVNNIVAFRLSTKRSAILRFFWGVADSASSAYQTHPCGTAITENGPLLARVLIRSINHVINHPMPPATCLVQFLLPASQPASQPAKPISDKASQEPSRKSLPQSRFEFLVLAPCMAATCSGSVQNPQERSTLHNMYAAGLVPRPRELYCFAEINLRKSARRQ